MSLATCALSAITRPVRRARLSLIDGAQERCLSSTSAVAAVAQAASAQPWSWRRS